jgi:uncharacterized protein (DUF2062 family)
VNETFHPLLAPFILSSSISIATSYLCFQKYTWELFHRIQLFKKKKKREEKAKRVRKKNKERIKGQESQL